MTHVHARLSALVDGELDHESRDRVLAHLAHCQECRTAADAERRVKALLAGMPGPTPSERLHADLMRLAEAGPDIADGRAESPFGGRTLLLRRQRAMSRPAAAVRRVRRGLPTRAEALLASTRRPTAPPGGSRHPGSRPRRLFVPASGSGRFQRRVAAGVAGVAAMAGMAVVAAFAAGGGSDVTVVPPVQQYSVEHANTVSDLPLSDPGAVTAVLDRELLDHASGR